MEKEENLVKAFTGTEPNALLLKQMLEEAGVKSLIKNDSALSLLGGRPEVVNLYIFDEDMEKAKPLIEEMKKVEEPEVTDESLESEDPKKPQQPPLPPKPPKPGVPGSREPEE